ncbi:MAG: hypothetical protein ACK6AT_00645, partial [Planctomycetota bacterium]
GARLLAMRVAVTITPGLSYHVLKHGFVHSDDASTVASGQTESIGGHAAYDPQAVSKTLL